MHRQEASRQVFRLWRDLRRIQLKHEVRRETIEVPLDGLQ